MTFKVSKKPHRSVPLSDAPFITMYHGTSKEKAEKIKKEGLKAIPFEGKGNIAFVTPQKTGALFHAKYRSVNDNGSIFKIKIPVERIEKEDKPMFEYIKGDKYWAGPEDPKSRPLRLVQEVRLKEDVKPEYIKEVPYKTIRYKEIRRVYKPQHIGQAHTIDYRKESPKGIAVQYEEEYGKEAAMKRMF